MELLNVANDIFDPTDDEIIDQEAIKSSPIVPFYSLLSLPALTSKAIKPKPKASKNQKSLDKIFIWRSSKLSRTYLRPLMTKKVIKKLWNQSPIDASPVLLKLLPGRDQKFILTDPFHEQIWIWQKIRLASNHSKHLSPA